MGFKVQGFRFQVSGFKFQVSSFGFQVSNLVSQISCLKLSVLGSLLFLLTSCYSFTGSSLSPEIKTIKINQFVNNAPLNNPTLAQQFTIDMQNRFLQRTTLKGTTANNPDILIEGEITNYNILETTISSPQEAVGGVVLQAAQNKLTISVKIHYENKIEPEKSFDRTFSDEVTFSSDLDINQIEATQVKIVNERIINKIFNDIIADW